jgi:hypothetical protein
VPDIVLLQAQVEGDGVDDRTTAGMQDPVIHGGEIESVAFEQRFYWLPDVAAYDAGDVPVDIEAPFPGVDIPVETHSRPLLGDAEAFKIDHARGSRGRRQPCAVRLVPCQYDRDRSVAEETVDNAGTRCVIKNIHRGVNFTADEERYASRMIPHPLNERIHPIQAGVASHADNVRPEEIPVKTQLPGKERAEPRHHESARGDAQHIVDFILRQRGGGQCVADGPGPDLKCP